MLILSSFYPNIYYNYYNNTILFIILIDINIYIYIYNIY